MSNQVFDGSNRFFAACSKIGDVLILNWMWILFSLPVVTIGASTTAACSVAMKLRKGNEGYVFSRFVKSFKQNFKQSTIIFLIMLLIGAVFGVDMLFWMSFDGALGKCMVVVTTVMVLFYAFILVYVFAVQAKFVNKIKDTLKNAFLMSVQNFPLTIIMVLLLGVYVFLNIYIIGMIGISILGGVGGMFYLFATLYNGIFKRYIEEEEEEEEIDEWTANAEEPARVILTADDINKKDKKESQNFSEKDEKLGSER